MGNQKANYETAPARASAARRAGVDDVLLLDAGKAQLLLLAMILLGIFLLAEERPRGAEAKGPSARAECLAPTLSKRAGGLLVAASKPPNHD